MRWVLAVATLAACHHARSGSPPPAVVVEVSALLPGASSDVVASSVATPLERALAQLPHVVSLTSTSRSGSTLLRVGFDGEDRFAAQQAVQGALNQAADLLPRTMPAPPIYTSGPGPLVGRYLVASDNAEATALRASQMTSVGLIETCGDRPREWSIDVDTQRLAAFGLTITELLDAVRAAPDTAAKDASDLKGLQIASRNGAPVRLGDVANVRDHRAPATCMFFAATPGVVELVIHAQTAASVEQVRAELRPLGLVEMPPRRELHVELASDVSLDAATAALYDALAGLPRDSFEVEIRDGSARVLANTDDALAVLRKMKIVVAAGEPTATVHVSGADPAAVASAARLIEARLRHRELLAATHGLATRPTNSYDVDRDAAARLGIQPGVVEATLAAADGVTASTVFTQQSQVLVMLSATSRDHLFVRASSGTLVPLDQVVRTNVTSEPVEVLHRGQVPDVDLEVHGDPTAAIGAVPAGVRVEVD